MPLLDDKVRTQLSGILKNMGGPVTIEFFTQEFECRACGDTHAFLEEFASISDSIKLIVHDFIKDRALAEKAGVDKIPAIVIKNGNGDDTRMRFYGLPGGYEINSFIVSLLEASGKKEPLPDELAARIATIKTPVHIQVFVTLTCPYCPSAVGTVHRLALENKNIRADMVDAALFPHLVQKYDVSGVPRIIINEAVSLVGAQPIDKILEAIEKLS